MPKFPGNLLDIEDPDRPEPAETDMIVFAPFDIDDSVAAPPSDFSRPLAARERVFGRDTARHSPPGEIRRDAERVPREMNGVDWSAPDIRETAGHFAWPVAAPRQCRPFREGTRARRLRPPRGFPRRADSGRTSGSRKTGRSVFVTRPRKRATANVPGTIA
jgi:hypothetical protein